MHWCKAICHWPKPENAIQFYMNSTSGRSWCFSLSEINTMCAIFTAFHKFNQIHSKATFTPLQWLYIHFLSSQMLMNSCITAAINILFRKRCIYFCLFSSKVVYLSNIVSYISIMSLWLIENIKPGWSSTVTPQLTLGSSLQAQEQSCHW